MKPQHYNKLRGSILLTPLATLLVLVCLKIGGIQYLLLWILCLFLAAVSLYGLYLLLK